MCIICRQRLSQSVLHRLYFDHNAKCFLHHQGFGRSFYLCKPCVQDTKNHKRLAKNLKLSLKNLQLNLKELDIE